MPSRNPSAEDRKALALAFRLALLDALPPGAGLRERCDALEAARDRLAALLSGPGPALEVPETLRDIRDRATLAHLLQAGFEEAWATVAGSPFPRP